MNTEIINNKKTDLKLYNTLTKKIDRFLPIEENVVKMYTCGPTVYNYAHIGNLRTYIFEDLLKRTLTYIGYKVNHVMNVTDVGHLVSDEDQGEDKMEIASKRENKNIYEIADFYFEAFKKDLIHLNIIYPTTWCKATDHIQEQIDLIKMLDEKGVIYSTEDGVYLDTSKVDNYGELAGLDIEGLREGARIGVVTDKKNKTDFALWKLSPKDETRLMEWDSPWGVGFPGWHIECSAMALKYLGEEIDIHCGGIDHIPVHHTNEIAQTETALGKKWVNYWLHGEFLVMKNGKMSKSNESFITVTELIKRNISPLAYRYYCLNSHYRKQLTFTWEAMESAEAGLQNLYKTVRKYKKASEGKESNISKEYLSRFIDSSIEDLNIPLSVAVMWEMINDNKIDDSTKYYTMIEMDKILGFGLDKVQLEEKEEINNPEVNALLEERQLARKNKDFAKSDEIRDRLLEMGYKIKDTREGTTVEKI